MPASKANSRRYDIVLIRRSSDSQEVKEQEANVRRLLKQRNVKIPSKSRWYEFTLGRRKVLNSADFEAVLEQVRNGKVRNIYVESQDRFGSKNNKQLFAILYQLQESGSRLWDLKNNRDLTSNDFVTELQTLFDGNKSQQELRDLAYRSSRSRVNMVLNSGSWPVGTQPFGYAKACYNSSKRTLWTFHPEESRWIGQVYFANNKGKLVPGPKGVKIPRKNKGELTFLVPHNDKEQVRTIKRIFKLFTTDGLARRQIAIRLNKSGQTYYGKPFTHSHVGEFLKNPAYIGETHYGKNQTGELYSHDSQGNMIPLFDADESTRLSANGTVIKKGTHKPLIDKKTWDDAQERLQSEEQDQKSGNRTYNSVNPKYWLKQLLVCGHCKKGMTGRTDNGVIKYLCSSYSTALSNGQKSKCGFQTIRHEVAEQLIFGKLKELGIRYEQVTGNEEKKLLIDQIYNLEHESEESNEQFRLEIDQGVKALMQYLSHNTKLTKSEIAKLKIPTQQILRFGKVIGPYKKTKLPMAIKKLKETIKEMEKTMIETAKNELDELTNKHSALTRSWAMASDQQKAVLQPDIVQLEQDINKRKSEMKPLTKRLRAYYIENDNRAAERSKLISEWEGTSDRAKGESLRRIFDRVELYWKTVRHEPEKNPSRERKTNRKGRFSYPLQKDKIKFVFRDLDMDGSS